MVKLKLTPYISRRLVVLTTQMRTAQRLYFKTRSSIDLGLAKRQEQMLDRLLAVIDLGDATESDVETFATAATDSEFPWDNPIGNESK